MSLPAVLWLYSLIGIFTSQSFSQDTVSTGTALLQRAIILTDLRQSGPYHIHNLLTMTDSDLGPKEGFEDIYFVSSQKWRRELRVKGYYEESAIFLDDKMYRGRNPNFTPLGARQDTAARIRDLSLDVEMRVKNVYPLEIAGSKSQCVELTRNEKESNVVATWCFDAATGLPVARFATHSKNRTEFRDYKPLGEKFVPGVVEMFRNNESKRRAELATIQLRIPEKVGFEPPPGYEARTWCDDMHPVRLESRKGFDLPTSARLNHGLELMYEAIVDEHGNVKTVTAMQPKPVADNVIIPALFSYKFKPARCGSTPVLTDIVLDAQELWK